MTEKLLGQRVYCEATQGNKNLSQQRITITEKILS
jgi:hypothetical protein